MADPLAIGIAEAPQETGTELGIGSPVMAIAVVTATQARAIPLQTAAAGTVLATEVPPAAADRATPALSAEAPEDSAAATHAPAAHAARPASPDHAAEAVVGDAVAAEEGGGNGHVQGENDETESTHRNPCGTLCSLPMC